MVLPPARANQSAYGPVDGQGVGVDGDNFDQIGENPAGAPVEGVDVIPRADVIAPDQLERGQRLDHANRGVCRARSGAQVDA